MAVIHFNANLRRDERVTTSGKTQVKVVYPKFKNGEATVRSVRVGQNFGMIILWMLVFSRPLAWVGGKLAWRPWNEIWLLFFKLFN